MKTAFHIWITALIIQPIIYIFIIGELALFVVPVEIFGGIPGLVLFRMAMWAITKSKIRIVLKWTLLLLSAIFSAFFCDYLFFLQGDAGLLDSESLLFIMPALVAAVIGVAINCSSINRLFIEAQDAREAPNNPEDMDHQNEVQIKKI